VRFDWALPGAAAVGDGVEVAVLVDVLSFTTTLTVALERGATVLPYRWADPAGAAQHAREHDAELAVGRFRARVGQVSLSPVSVRNAAALGRLVLPSPNGSTIAYQLGAGTSICLAACLRNAGAVAAWIAAHFQAMLATAAVIGAGERWEDGSLRPAVEDLWGAGAVIAGLNAAGWTSLSPEADAARAAYEAVRGDEHDALRACASGQELIASGFEMNVAIAAEVGRSHVVPSLVDGCFVPT
jgi:2-phosphosulfolactate phosphatase